MLLSPSPATRPGHGAPQGKRLGIWVNVEAFDVDLAPSFYAVATTGPFDRVVSEASDLWHQISVRQLIRAVTVPVQHQ